jgi:hypothetical protein
MKTRTIVILTSVAAAAIIFGQWAIVMGWDNFTLVDSHKVFSYGFPFRIVDSPDMPIHTPGWQVPLRLFGNFTSFFAAGLVVVWFIRRIHDRTPDHESAA